MHAADTLYTKQQPSFYSTLCPKKDPRYYWL